MPVANMPVSIQSSAIRPGTALQAKRASEQRHPQQPQPQFGTHPAWKLPFAKIWALFLALPVMVTAAVAWFIGKMTDTDPKLDNAVGALLKEKKLTVAVAESCTGGLVSSRLTNVSGSSQYTTLNLVTYSNEDKARSLQVDTALLDRDGPVNAAVAEQMARGVKRLTGATIGLATTGFVGPDPSAKEPNPHGLAYIGLVMDDPSAPTGERVQVVRYPLDKAVSRPHAKFRFSQKAMELLKDHLERWRQPGK